MVMSNSRTFGKLTSHQYNDDENAIMLADFGADSMYFVGSKELAVAIYKRNMDYDAEHLKRGLKDGWLNLVINPILYESLSNKLAAIRAIKSDVTPDEGWYKLIILPEFGRRR